MKPYYDHAGVQIFHGDCREILPQLPKSWCVTCSCAMEDESILAIHLAAKHTVSPFSECVITDPPYDSMTHEGAIGVSIDFEPLESPAKTAEFLLRFSSRWCLAFCALEQLGEYKRGSNGSWVRAGVWDRVINMPQMSGDRPAQGAEGIAIFHPEGKKSWNGGGKAAIWRVPFEERGFKLHPTEKPLRLIKELVGLFSDAGESVLDPFMGSGTTLIAAKDLGRRAIGIEIEEKYCEIAAKRLSQEVFYFK